jgi:23S rRNA pseudouridine1911/1915/1917 synthase
VEDNDLLIITNEEAGERLDKILAARFCQIKSRTYFQYLIEEKKVLLNGNFVKKGCKPTVGDEVEIQFVISPEVELIPENIPLNIIYEDEYIIVVNKPAGMVVHPAKGNWSGTFVNALLYHCQNLSGFPTLSESSKLRPGIVHRLDKDTSGLLIAAKTELAHQKLIDMFSGRKIQKEYLAICCGNPGNVQIDASIGRDPLNRKLMTTVDKGGKKSLSICKTLAYDDKISFVTITLATGRTHQIRVHMQHIGTPILGDNSYGIIHLNKKYDVKRQMLHAHFLGFSHPITGKIMELTSPLPLDMDHILGKIKDKRINDFR